MGENMIEKFEQRQFLQFSEETTYEEWLEVGNSLMQATQNIMWWLGDWWNFGEHKYGELAAQALSMNIPYSTFSSAAAVSRAFPIERRVEDLSWSHHKEVAFMDDNDVQDSLLLESVRSGLTTKALRQKVKDYKVSELASVNAPIDPMQENSINYKPTNMWTFGYPIENFGVDNLSKTPPQMIANLMYFFMESEDKLVVDLTDKYEVTYDVSKAFGLECRSFDADPDRNATNVTQSDFSVDKYDPSIADADMVFLNILDYGDDPSVPCGPFLRKQILDLGVSMKKDATLFVIAEDYDDWRLENTFDLIFNDSQFGLREFISIPNKSRYSKDEELNAISSRYLLPKAGYILVLTKENADF